MKVALIGASGNGGSRLLAELSGRGHEVTAIARNPDTIAKLPGVTIKKGDVFDKPALIRLLKGHDAVISAVHFTASDPKLLMLDEPSLGLAPAVVESMYETFGRLHREGLTILLAEQSIELALEVSDFATVLQVGKSVLSGTAAALAQDPQVQKAYLGSA